MKPLQSSSEPPLALWPVAVNSPVKNSISPRGRPHEGRSPITRNPHHYRRHPDSQLSIRFPESGVLALHRKLHLQYLPRSRHLLLLVFTAKAIPSLQAAKQHHLCWQLPPGLQETVESFVVPKALKTIIFPKVASHRRNRLFLINYIFLCYFFLLPSITICCWPSTVICGPTWVWYLAHCTLHFSYRRTAHKADLLCKNSWDQYELIQHAALFPEDATGFARQEAQREAQATATQHSWHCTKLPVTFPILSTFPNLPSFCFFTWKQIKTALEAETASVFIGTVSKVLSIKSLGCRHSITCCRAHLPCTLFAIFLLPPSLPKGEHFHSSLSNITYREHKNNHPHSENLK